jgi:hypothetical protein
LCWKIFRVETVWGINNAGMPKMWGKNNVEVKKLLGPKKGYVKNNVSYTVFMFTIRSMILGTATVFRSLGIVSYSDLIRFIIS